MSFSRISRGGRTANARFVNAFYANVDHLTEDGTLNIKCKKMLWSVEGKDPVIVLGEAMHYFSQYYFDGEYETEKNHE
tara:strand:- start:8383 stop:8616 length:234 start_codon:yes stop_codon:yes gene_type:complete